MLTSMCFQICSLFYMLLLTTVYFSKKRLNTLENKIYIAMVITDLCSLVLDIFSIYTIIHMDTLPIINLLVTKFYLVFLLAWIFLFTIYLFVVSLKTNDTEIKSLKDSKICQKLFLICGTGFFIYVLGLIIFPLYYMNEGNVIYSYGPAAYWSYFISGILVVAEVLCTIINIKNIRTKKLVPIFAFIILGTGTIIIQMINPGLLLISFIDSFITFLMYFTIENPDLKMINELNIARDQAEKANNAKSDFLSSMSHEIRTPLNAIVGFSESLQEEDIPAYAKAEVKDIVMASQNLLELVNGILDISKIEANKIEIVNTEYHPKQIMDELVSLTKARLGDKPLDFRISIDKSIPAVLYGDYTRVKQIILNLLTNAVKYTKEGYIEFKVSTVVKADVCRLIVSVEDSGIGIKQENIGQLFTKFQRLDLEQNGTIEGTGLGLAIAKRLIELMNGKIVVQSVYGKGSRFTVALDQKVIKMIDNEEVKEEINEVEYFDLSDKSVLVVDDNTLNLKVASRLLQNYNIQIETVTSGAECLDKINSGVKYDIILCDDMMPKMSGTETLQKLKEIENFDIPVIALTANAIAGMKEKYLQAGFNDYLSKPIEKPELNRVLKKYLTK